MTQLPVSSPRRQLLVAGGSAVAFAPCLFWPRAVLAQGAYPSHPVKLIVPNAPASSVDTIGRIAANQLAAATRQAFVIDNRAGAAGAIGVDQGRRSPADGYTFIVASSSSMSVAPLLQKAANYDPLKDFEFVSLIAMLPNVLVCTPALPVRTPADLIAHAKARKGQTNMASAGIGSVSHLAGVALQEAGGFESLHVPYKGGSQGVASVAAGETDWVLTPAPAALGLVASGRLRLLGHSMPRESRPLGAVPAIADTVPGFEFASWVGLMAPKGIPAAAAEFMRTALVAALQQPALRELFESNGAVPTAATPQEFRNYLARDIELNRKAVKAANLQPE